MLRPPKYRPSLLLTISSLVAAIWFAVRVTTIFSINDNLTDFDICLDAARHFQQTGELYLRIDPLRSDYQAGAAIYKFPPAHQILILPFMKLDFSRDTIILASRLFYLALYILAAWLIHSMLTTGRGGVPEHHPVMLLPMILMSSFYICLWKILPELPLFLLLTVMAISYSRYPLLAGFACGVAAMIKIYPAFLLLFFIFTRNKKALTGFAFSLVVMFVLSSLLTSFHENIFYFTKILPIMLGEEITPNLQNLALGTVLYRHRLVESPEMFTTTSRIIDLLVIAGTGIWLVIKRIRTATEQDLFLAALLSGMLCYLTNYWEQYQLVLLLPFYLIIKSLRSHPIPGVKAVAVLSMLVLYIDVGWLWDEMIHQFPGILDANNIHQPFSPEWMLMVMHESKSLVPYILMLLSLFLLIQIDGRKSLFLFQRQQ